MAPSLTTNRYTPAPYTTDTGVIFLHRSCLIVNEPPFWFGTEYYITSKHRFLCPMHILMQRYDKFLIVKTYMQQKCSGDYFFLKKKFFLIYECNLVIRIINKTIWWRWQYSSCVDWFPVCLGDNHLNSTFYLEKIRKFEYSWMPFYPVYWTSDDIWCHLVKLLNIRNLMPIYL